MKRTIAAATLFASALAVSAPAFAMEEELSMLEAAVENALSTAGVTDVDIMTLTVSQLALIKNVLESDANDTSKKARIEAIIAR